MDITNYPELANYNNEHYYDVPREDDGTPAEELCSYEVVFETDENRYYCYLFGINLNEALGQFFRSHPHVTYEMVVDHFEV